MTEFHRHPSQPEFDGDTCVSAVDWLGNRFHVGDTVIYCVGAGRGQMMAIGTVQKMRSRHRTHRGRRAPDDGEEPEGHLTVEGHQPYPYVTYTEEWDDVEVQVLTTTTSGAYGYDKRSRPAWVNPMNITALNGIEYHIAHRWAARDSNPEPSD